ncbi:MAG: DUF58 domain-containing protein [Chloroflexi bacterium]|nr:DUF58 domain-containing protein [Chloroflexota bacterium]
MVTVRGVGVIVTAILVLILAGLTRIGWLLLFDAVLWGAIVVSAAMPWIAVGDLRIRRRISRWHGAEDYPGPMVGDPVELDIALENRGFLPCMFVTVGYNYGDQGIESAKKQLFIAWLGRRREQAATTQATFTKRGLYQLPPLIVETQVPFGLFRRRKRVEDPMEVVVLPKVHRFAGLDMTSSSGMFSSATNRARVGDQITGSRNYVSGDPWHHIHWRNTARTNLPQVKEFEQSPDSALVVAFNIQEEGVQGGESALEHAVQIAASAGDHVCRSGGVVCIIANGVRQETSSRHLLLRSLALLSGEKGSRRLSLEEQAPPYTAVLVVLEESDGDGLRDAARLSAANRDVTAIVLRGFDKSSEPINARGLLSSAGARVIECWPGDVESSIAELGSVAALETAPNAAAGYN